MHCLETLKRLNKKHPDITINRTMEMSRRGVTVHHVPSPYARGAFQFLADISKLEAFQRQPKRRGEG